MRLAILVAALLIAGAAPVVRTPAPDIYNAPQAVMLAAQAAPRGVPGRFVMTIRATGRTRSALHLNSEADYRDQRNLSIAVSLNTMNALLRRAGVRNHRALVGRPIQVAGVARRVRIDFTANGRPSGRYYYQTHIPVARSSQIVFLIGEGAASPSR